MRAAFYTLGCKVNQNESAALEQMFCDAGYEIVAATAAADVYVVNSCTVTAEGDAKSRRWLHRARRQNPSAVTVLTGCFPQAFPQEALALQADVVTGTAARGRLLYHLEDFLATGQRVVDLLPAQSSFEELPAAHSPERTRAFVKIEDGCNRRCAYCIIPTARGPVRSRAEDSILAEVAMHAAQGRAEVVFTGISLPSYGRDSGTNLADIVDKVAHIEGVRRIRLSSLDPDLLDEESIARFAAQPKLCGHFHLSLQSGCDETLRRMRRPYTTTRYRAVAGALRAAIPGASLTTDVIVGFPGESGADFEESAAFVQEMDFLKVHVFPFSPRPGTPAAAFEGQLPKAERTRRAAHLQKLADGVRAEWIARRSLGGGHEQVLLEKPLPDGRFTGYTASYIPVAVRAPGAAQGDVVDITLGAFDGERVAAFLAGDVGVSLPDETQSSEIS